MNARVVALLCALVALLSPSPSARTTTASTTTTTTPT
jgi:hypothetical protein